MPIDIPFQARLARVGEFYSELAQRSLESYERELRMRLLAIEAARSRAWKEQRERPHPDFIRAAFDRAAQERRRNLSALEWMYPCDFPGASEREARDRSRQMMERLGSLYAAWPAIWRSTRAAPAAP